MASRSAALSIQERDAPRRTAVDDSAATGAGRRLAALAAATVIAGWPSCASPRPRRRRRAPPPAAASARNHQRRKTQIAGAGRRREAALPIGDVAGAPPLRADSLSIPPRPVWRTARTSFSMRTARPTRTPRWRRRCGPSSTPPDTTVRGREHPQCVFPARYRGSKAQLDFDPRQVPEVACPKFEEWRDAIHPCRPTLVFPEAYMNNPSSMFGHTLLRFDAEEGGERRDLLAYAGELLRRPRGDGAVDLHRQGIVRRLPGFFNVQPYYEKVSEYADWEQRDIWEYELDLSPDADRVPARAPVGAARRRLRLLLLRRELLVPVAGAAARRRPDLVYWTRFQLWAAPSDTVRAAVRDSGLLRRVTYRPSATTALRHEAGLVAVVAATRPRIAAGDAAPTDPRLAGLLGRRRARF